VNNVAFYDILYFIADRSIASYQ